MSCSDPWGCEIENALRARLAEVEAALNEKRAVAIQFKNLYTDALERAEASEARHEIRAAAAGDGRG